MKFKSFVLASLLITLQIFGVDPVSQIRDALKLTSEQSDKLRELSAIRLQSEQAAHDDFQAKIDALSAIQETGCACEI